MKQVKIVSERWHLTEQDLKKILRDSAIFLAPLAIVVIPQLQSGKSFEEISSNVYMWMLGILLNFFLKLSSEKTYIVKQ
jgi:hypothetical protein